MEKGISIEDLIDELIEDEEIKFFEEKYPVWVSPTLLMTFENCGFLC